MNIHIKNLINPIFFFQDIILILILIKQAETFVLTMDKIKRNPLILSSSKIFFLKF
jgi:hypothetical protein